MYKNIEKQHPLALKDLVEYQDGQVVSKTLVQNEKVSMTIFSFDKGEEISSHSAGGDVKPRAKRSSCPRVFPMRCSAKNASRCSL